MKCQFLILSLFSFTTTFCFARQKSLKTQPHVQYFDKNYFLIEGTSIADSLKESPYDRLPASYKEKVRKPVWALSKNAAGISIRFLSNSTSLNVRWKLLNDFSMNHMAATGIKGIDLYCKVNGDWRFVNTAKPSGKENKFLLVNNMPKKMREYEMFLPLYDGVLDLEIGIDSLCIIRKPEKTHQKPIVFYGTSITQGGCASRPGMAYTNIISRKIHRECINFGFSGNGRMEKVIAELISGINASAYVIDCVANMTADQIKDSTFPLTDVIRKKHPETPIIFIEGVLYQKSFLDTAVENELIKKIKHFMKPARIY